MNNPPHKCARIVVQQLGDVNVCVLREHTHRVQAMKKIKEVANVLHCPACALPFQACDALFQHLTVHSGLKLSSVSGILPPAASRGVTICDEVFRWSTLHRRAQVVFFVIH